MAENINRTALVTGGAKRIGREICLKLAEMGYDIVLTYLSSHDKALALKEQIESLGSKCLIKEFDLTEPEKIPEFMDEIINESPGLELVINNASLFEPCSLEETSLENLEDYLSIHLKSPFVIVREFARRTEKGHVVNILDTRISKHKTRYFGYLLSKKALAELTMLAASSLGPNIRVNGIAPGMILPPEGEDNHYLSKMSKKIPAGKEGSPKDITSALKFLVENDFLTGQIIYEDGGEHLL